jgi:hypothetical protein
MPGEIFRTFGEITGSVTSREQVLAQFGDRVQLKDPDTYLFPHQSGKTGKDVCKDLLFGSVAIDATIPPHIQVGGLPPLLHHYNRQYDRGLEKLETTSILLWSS